MRRTLLLSMLSASLAAAGCYTMRPSSGGGQVRFTPPRRVQPADVAVPGGYCIEAVATGFDFPTGVVFDDEDRIYVLEAGYAYGEVWTTPRLLRLEPDGTRRAVATGGRNGPWNGVAFHDGAFFIAEGGELDGGRILRVTREGAVSVLVDGLPSLGDHHTNGPAVGPDAWIYFGQGTATNSAVVGEDNARFGWLARQPRFHDVPCQDVTLAGVNYTSGNPLTPDPEDRATTGAFSPFAAATTKGQVVRGRVPCSGAVLRVRPSGGAPELVAWGFRNPFGLAFSPDGRLYITDNGYDDRGSRPVWGTGDQLWRVEPGTWYGWPDFSGGISLDGRKVPGKGRVQAVLASYPNKPTASVFTFDVHSSTNGIDFSRREAFGHVGQAFVAQFGDMAPGVGKVLHPVGFKVLRVDVEAGVVHEFAVNRGKTNGPASRIGGGGLERPVAVRFDRAGRALYVVDFGVMSMTAHGPSPQKGTGALWRIVRGERQ